MRPPSLVSRVTAGALFVVLGLVAINAARQEWTLTLAGLFLAVALVNLLALLPNIEDR